jgi:hypothetical protein
MLWLRRDALPTLSLSAAVTADEAPRPECPL